MGTVSKALTLLDYFSRTRPEIGLSDLARLSGMNKATVYRLLCELQAHGLVEQTHSGRAYRLGPAVLRLASLREATVPMRDVARNALQTLSDSTGETAHLSQVQGGRLVTLAYSYAQAHGTSVRMDDAQVLPVHATSSGLAWLAFCPDDARERILAAPLPAFTADTPTTAADVRARLDRIRATGIADSVGGFEADVHSIAVPLFDAAGVCNGAVAVATPTARMSPALRATIIEALLAGAHDIVALWGGFPPNGLQRVWANAI